MLHIFLGYTDSLKQKQMQTFSNLFLLEFWLFGKVFFHAKTKLFRN